MLIEFGDCLPDDTGFHAELTGTLGTRGEEDSYRHGDGECVERGPKALLLLLLLLHYSCNTLHHHYYSTTTTTTTTTTTRLLLLNYYHYRYYLTDSPRPLSL